MKSHKRTISRLSAVLLLTLLSAYSAAAQRTELEPGWNLFSPESDIEMGREVSRDAERELPIIDDAILAEYVNRLGLQLTTVTPGYDYPYQFKLVNDSVINAFALPGGFIYINRGIIEAADREAEVAGVIAHEIAHVALRHGTNQASKAYIAQAPLAILGGLFGGGGGVGSIVTQLGIGFGASSLFNKFSRDAERQADLMGAQILYDARYDPTGMTEFFEKIEAEGGGRGPEFLSSHPNPGNRIGSVSDEIAKLGDRPPTYQDNFSSFRRIKERLSEIPEASEDAPRSDGGRGEREPEAPADQYQRYRRLGVEIIYPTNWEVLESDTSVTLAPDDGVAGDGSLGYGMIVSTFERASDRRDEWSLEDGTDQLIDNLRASNPSLRVAQGYRRDRVGGRAAISVGLTSDSPFGGVETDHLVTAFGPDGTLHYFVAVTPERDVDAYEETFRTMFDSVRFR